MTSRRVAAGSGSARGSVSSASAASAGATQAALSGQRFYAAACRAHDASDLPAAITLYTTALQLEPDLLEAWIGRGVAYKESREYELSISDYSRALRLAPDDATTLIVLSNRANCLTAAGSFAAALTDHNSAISLNRHNDAVLYANRGSTLMKMKRFDDAERDFVKSLECDPAYAVAHYNLGLLFGQQGRINECSKHLEKAAALFEKSSCNAAHAEDCNRQLAIFTGHGLTAQRDIPTPSASARSRASIQHIEISPLSPVNQKGITRSGGGGGSGFAFVTPSSSPAATPSATPSSRVRLDRNLLSSDDFEESARRVSPAVEHSSSFSAIKLAMGINTTSALPSDRYVASDAAPHSTRPPQLNIPAAAASSAPYISLPSPIGSEGSGSSASPLLDTAPSPSVASAKRRLSSVKPPASPGVRGGKTLVQSKGSGSLSRHGTYNEIEL